MDIRFWKRKRPTLKCDWSGRSQPPGFECYGRVYVYECVADDGSRDKDRKLCDTHMREKNRDLDDGWKLVRRH